MTIIRPPWPQANSPMVAIQASIRTGMLRVIQKTASRARSLVPESATRASTTRGYSHIPMLLSRMARAKVNPRELARIACRFRFSSSRLTAIETTGAKAYTATASMTISRPGTPNAAVASGPNPATIRRSV